MAKSLDFIDYLLASSIATATATVIHSLWVVTCADESHHLFAVDALGELQSGMLFEKSYYIRLRELLNHKIIFAEHIVCVFPENIITRFDVSVNDVSEEFAEKLRFLFFCWLISSGRVVPLLFIKILHY